MRRLVGRGGRLVLGGGGDPVDGLRALCVAAWSVADRAAPDPAGADPPDAAAALARLRWDHG